MVRYATLLSSSFRRFVHEPRFGRSFLPVYWRETENAACSSLARGSFADTTETGTGLLEPDVEGCCDHQALGSLDRLSRQRFQSSGHAVRWWTVQLLPDAMPRTADQTRSAPWHRANDACVLIEYASTAHWQRSPAATRGSGTSMGWCTVPRP
jgi:hypothetical protein